MKRILTFALSSTLFAFACQGCFTVKALASMSDKNGTSYSIGSYATSVYNPIPKYMDMTVVNVRSVPTISTRCRSLCASAWRRNGRS